MDDRCLMQVPRSVIEATAIIMGPDSAAAMALACADEHDGEILFFRSGEMIYVEKLPATSN